MYRVHETEKRQSHDAHRRFYVFVKILRKVRYGSEFFCSVIKGYDIDFFVTQFGVRVRHGRRRKKQSKVVVLERVFFLVRLPRPVKAVNCQNEQNRSFSLKQCIFDF